MKVGFQNKKSETKLWKSRVLGAGCMRLDFFIMLIDQTQGLAITDGWKEFI